MKRFLSLLAVGLLTGIGASPVLGAITFNNGGFENGDLSGWTSTLTFGPPPTPANQGVAQAIGTIGIDKFGNVIQGKLGKWFPNTGNFFGYLRAPDSQSISGTTPYATLQSTFSGSAGDQIVFGVFFDAADPNTYHPINNSPSSDGQGGFRFNDDVYLSINGVNVYTANSVGVVTVLGTEVSPFVPSSTGNLDDPGATNPAEWREITFTLPSTGQYSIELGARNVTDNQRNTSPAIGFDLIRTVNNGNGGNPGGGNPPPTNGQVPEPATALIWLLGAAGTVAWRSRRR